MAAEYEVNIKLNTQQVERQLNSIDTRTKRTGRMATENINALVKGQDKRARLMNKINELEAKGLNVAKLRKQMGKATNELAKRRFGSLQQEFRVLERSIRLEESKLRIMRSQAAATRDRAKFLAGAQVPGLERGQTLGPARPSVQGPRQMIASPIGGATNIKGSPAFLARQRRNKRLEQVGLGAGFPLLFGGGAGSVLGGAVGGLTGSFGAQIAFSAIGQQIDQFVAGIVEAGKALTSVGSAADFMAEKSLFSSDAMQFRIEKLIEEGQVTEAAALLSQEMAKQVGGSGLKALKDLGDEASKMGKIFGTLLIRVQAFLAKALTPLLKLINSAVGGLTAQSQLDQMIAEAGSSERGAQILARSRELRGVRRSARTGKAAGLGQLTPEVIQKLQEEFPAIIPEGAAIEPKQLELLRAADQGGGKAAREEERLQKRLAKLDAERKKVLEISRFKDKIAAAEAADDKQLVIRLKGEQKIEEIEASRLKALAGVTDQHERDAINIEKATEKLAAHRTVERELGELQRARQEKFEDTIEDLDHQLALARATTDEERERLRIERQLALLKKGGMQDPELGEVRFKMEQLAQENTPLNQAIKGVREEINNLNDPIKHIIDLANTLGSAFSESFKGIISGSMTAREALANLFQRTADHFLDMAAQMIAAQIKMQILNIGLNFLGGLGGGGGGFSLGSPDIGGTFGVTPKTAGLNFSSAFSGRALGGQVGAGRPYIVGERGPEMFVPGAQGNIVPNNAMGSTSIVVNVDASGSSVEGEAEQSRQLGKMLGAAVQAELVKQKRPGGLLAT